MDEIAEKGYAAHYGYKHNESKKSEVDLWLNKLQEVLNQDSEHAIDFVEDFKLNFYSKEIYVLENRKVFIEVLTKDQKVLRKS